MILILCSLTEQDYNFFICIKTLTILMFKPSSTRLLVLPSLLRFAYALIQKETVGVESRWVHCALEKHSTNLLYSCRCQFYVVRDHNSWRYKKSESFDRNYKAATTCQKKYIKNWYKSQNCDIYDGKYGHGQEAFTMQHNTKAFIHIYFTLWLYYEWGCDLDCWKKLYAPGNIMTIMTMMIARKHFFILNKAQVKLKYLSTHILG